MSGTFLDSLSNFSFEWEQVGALLRFLKSSASLSGSNFEQLACILTGVAFMKSIPRGVSYRNFDMAAVDER